MRLGAGVREVLEAHIRAGGDRFRGIRHSAAWNAEIQRPANAPDPHLCADPRFRELFASWTRTEQLEQAVVAIPSARPIRTNVNFTSGFGLRSDPFRGRAAMHGGIDLAGPVGTPIYATADGLVAKAEWNNGGYGNLVEINHGQGILTRYGHLSRIAAKTPDILPHPAQGSDHVHQAVIAHRFPAGLRG